MFVYYIFYIYCGAHVTFYVHVLYIFIFTVDRM